jgi:uncharacterized protein YndB with AHSA1/START domain
VRVEAERPIVWRLSLASSPERVFELLDTDAGRERFWADRSHATDDGFELEFPGGLTSGVQVLERTPPTRLVIDYLGSRAELDSLRATAAAASSRSRATATIPRRTSSSSRAG